MAQSGGFGHAYFARAYQDGYFRRNPPRKARYYLSRIRRAAPGGLLLDIGCSYGAFLRDAREHFDCRGCDVDAQVVAAAREGLAGVEVFQASLPHVPADREHDVVTCLDVLEHVPDVPAALANLRELLRPGGVLCAVVPVYDGPLGWLIRALDRDDTHLHRRGRWWWREQILAAGFTELCWEGIVRYPVGRWYLHVAGGWLRRSGAACLFLVRRPEEAVADGYRRDPGLR